MKEFGRQKERKGIELLLILWMIRVELMMKLVENGVKMVFSLKLSCVKTTMSLSSKGKGGSYVQDFRK